MSKIYSFDQLTDSVELLEKKPPRFIMGLLVFLCVSFVVFIGWAYFGKVDVVSKGTAIIQGETEIQISRAQIPGSIDQIAVQNGDEVQEGDIIVQLKNQELLSKQEQIEQFLKNFEEQKGMLEQLKKSIQSHKAAFSANVDTKIVEEYKAYEQGYKSLETDKETEIKMLDDNQTSNGKDEALQSFYSDKDIIQKEIQALEKQKEQENVPVEQKQLMIDKINAMKSQASSIEKKIENRKVTLENERSKVDTVRENKKTQKNNALNQYKENYIVSVNQRIQSIEQEIFVKKQELESMNSQNKMTEVKAQKEGIVQFPITLQPGDPVNVGQEIVSIVPKEDGKKVKVFLPVEERKSVQVGNEVHYSFKLQNIDKQTGEITYISADPVFNKESNMYMYEVETTIDVKEVNELHKGMMGKVSVVTEEEPVWKFIFRKLDFI
ncbi:HlyD family efflux transporter periplasmic adaptor subunit [Priestia taiwanensis]|uniref:HlyD family type I secretion periplasmic adaptor subunit n=1 Tax=Priestia taiwanensis TaxID=1347902 RepID=A0A917AX35_9BACI|nr:HlyD family efflux transporter periplasmic adaptor subunit [Priestia taiwanensis]MBM7365297.1 multidrug efflux pump subunit AcrA (membrane-fusion protein) [Priestia taiwanensis]GGE85976.1 HlyD family type I secretion periplasmic adaptor subunit [Priestia taiwanensis]